MDGWGGGVRVCVGDGAGGGGLAMVAVDVWGVVAEEVVVVVPVGGGGVLCVVLVLFLSGVWELWSAVSSCRGIVCFGGVAADVAIASLSSSSCSLHAFA